MSWPSRTKYSNLKTSHAGFSFDSKLEALYYSILLEEEKEGLIKDIQTQVAVYLTDARILYKCDFKVFDLERNREVWREVKGFETPVWRIKRRLWKGGYGPGVLQVYKKLGSGLALQEEILPKIWI